MNMFAQPHDDVYAAKELRMAVAIEIGFSRRSYAPIMLMRCRKCALPATASYSCVLASNAASLPRNHTGLWRC